jgi:hypothetical protein
MTVNYQGMSTEELIAEFVSSELRVPIPLAEEICNRPDSVPYLARIIEEDKYRKWGGPGDAWSPIHALHLLGGMKTTEALQALIATLRDRGEDIGDWLTEDMPSILANFGTSAVEPLKAMIPDDSLDDFVRGAASTALVVIAYNHTEYRGPVIKLFRQIVKEANVKRAEELNYTFITLIVDDLAELKDPEAFEDIKQAFENELIDEFFIDFDDIQRIYGTSDKDMHYHRHEKDPMDHFSQKNIERLYKISYGTKKKQTKKYQVTKKKIGRNDPCPCGSGNKYKKCCLRKDLL